MFNFKKTIALAVVAILAMGAFTGCIQNTNPAVRVNDTDMTADEFGYYVYISQSQMIQEAGVSTSDADAVEQYWEEETDGKKNIDAALDKAVEDASNLLVRYNKAIEMGIEFTDEDKADLDAQIASMKEQTGGEMGYKNQLAMLGTTAEAFESLYKKNMIVSKLAEKLEADGTLAVDDNAVKDYITNNYVKAQHILFLTQDQTTGESFDAATLEEKRAKAEATLEKIDAGEDFAALMNELSEDTGLANYPDGYEFTKGEMVPQFEEAAFGLEVNAVSGIVETSYGYHIIKRLPFEVTEEKIAQYSENAKAAVQSEKMETLTKEWKEASEVKSFKSVIRKFK
jgi:parvulin-like peptidyl-prolyl isomerase